MAEFIVAYRRLMGHEGGYVNHKSDRGKETYKGISRKFHPAWAGWKIIDALRNEPGFPGNLKNHVELNILVEEFYKAEYWDKFNGDNIYPQPIADELLDVGVNMGINYSGRFAQDALNLLNRNGKLFPDVLITGTVGPKTTKLINEFDEPAVLLKTINALQAARYIDICKADKTQEDFFRGWLNRT